MDPTTLPPPTALHLGALHPVEQLLVYLLAFGPFAVLALVVVLRRRRGPGADPASDEPVAGAAQRPQRDR